MNLLNVDHVSIQTNNFDYALEFYTNILGLRITMPPYNFKNRRLCYLSANNIKIELYSCKPEKLPSTIYNDNRAGLDHIAFSVNDIFEFIKQIEKKGVEIKKHPFKPPTNDPNQVFIAVIEGPDGQEIEIRECNNLIST